MQEKLLKILSEILGVPVSELSENASMENIESWDSINHLNIVIALEQNFKVKLDPSNIDEMVSVGAILNILTMVRANE